MSEIIPDKYLDILGKKSFAHLATLMPDGSPQSTPVWCDYDGEHVVINSAKGRQKDKNMKRNSKVALSLLDPDNPYRYIEIRGEIVEITEAGAEEHIDKLAKKYLGLDRYPDRAPGAVRVIYKIKPQHTTSMG